MARREMGSALDDWKRGKSRGRSPWGESRGRAAAAAGPSKADPCSGRRSSATVGRRRRRSPTSGWRRRISAERRRRVPTRRWRSWSSCGWRGSPQRRATGCRHECATGRLRIWGVARPLAKPMGLGWIQPVHSSGMERVHGGSLRRMLHPSGSTGSGPGLDVGAPTGDEGQYQHPVSPVP